MVLKVGLIGYGHWGPNLLRNLLLTNQLQVVAVSDSTLRVQQILQSQHPQLTIYAAGEELIYNADIDAVVIATPTKTHYKLTKQALDKSIHVLVEKPLTDNSLEAAELVQIARNKGITLMVDHILLFNDAIKYIKQITEQGELGELTYYDATRINLGNFQKDVNVLWDLAPHEFAVIDFLFASNPMEIDAKGICQVVPSQVDTCDVTLYYPQNKFAHLKFSWLAPTKFRKLIINGTKKMVIWDEINIEQPINIFQYQSDFNSPPKFTIIEHSTPKIMKSDALLAVINHFASVIKGQEKSIMSGDIALKLIKIIEIANDKIKLSLIK